MNFAVNTNIIRVLIKIKSFNTSNVINYEMTIFSDEFNKNEF